MGTNFRRFRDAMTDPSNTRMTQLREWLGETLPALDTPLSPASGDASFRRYFRTSAAGKSWIVMDAPPATENVRAFVEVADILRRAGITVPDVRAVDLERGFTLLSDLGNTRYQDALSDDTADRLYRDAIATLARMQRSVSANECQRPLYDAALLQRELNLFREWYLERLLGIDLGPPAAAQFEAVCSTLVDSALDQPTVFVHRDFHSRNLMVHPDGNPGVLDFQDAVVGPVSYDLVSLLRDCYIDWPENQVNGWMENYLALTRTQALLTDAQIDRFPRWFDLMGMQRHLKAVGIFARLKIRDGKAGYLGDIPRTLGYVTAVCAKYPEFSGFGAFLRRAAESETTHLVPA
jgi:aminoglycoside/choline kinase family phosphotransferase